MGPSAHTVSTAIVGLFVTLSVWYLTLTSEQRAFELEFSGRANNQHTILQNGIGDYWDRLYAVRALFESSGHVTREEFETFARSLLENHPAIMNISWLPRVKRDERAAHEREGARDGLPDYHIRAIAEDGSLPISPVRDEYFPKFYSTEDRNSPVYGLDNQDGAGREQALGRIRDGDTLASSPPLTLHIGNGDRRGFWAGIPVYAPGRPHGTVEERRKNLRGIVQGVFQVGVMVDSIFDAVRSPVRQYIFAPGAALDEAPVFFRSRFTSEPIATRTQAELSGDFHRSFLIDIGDHQWTFVLAPDPAAGGPLLARHVLSTIVLICGLVLTAALTAFIAAVRRYAADMETAQNKIARQNVRFDAALNNMTQGLLMYDADGKLAVTNRRMAQLFGLPWEIWKVEAIGTTPLQSLQLAYQMTNVGMKNPQQVLGELQNILESRKPGRIVFERNNGRTYSSLCSPMPDGGFVVTFNDFTDRRRAEEKIAHMAHFDTLTDLPNRGHFNDRIKALLRSAGKHARFAVFSLDLDGFKEVNDSLGHPAGDKLLQAVATRMRSCVRDIDIIARLGGDEFAIVQPTFENPTDTVALAKRLIASISAPYVIDGHRVTVGTSIGIALAPEDGADPELLMKNADAALYRSKARGGGTYQFFKKPFEPADTREHATNQHRIAGSRLHA